MKSTEKIKVTFTYGEIINAPNTKAWDSLCEKYGYNPWILNEGLAQSSDSVEITLQEAIDWGLSENINE